MIAQPALFEGLELSDIVNVAQVPKYSPFRYPGGKTWLVPRVRKWLRSLSNPQTIKFYEPFAGGGIISLTVAFEGLADHITMVELDAEVAAVWETIIDGDPDWLANRIVTFGLTPETLQKALSKKTSKTHEVAFKTILKNRTFHGGILANGSGVLKHGENGKGIHSRWYAQTLKKRILHIKQVSDRITFLQDDGLNIIKKYRANKNAVWFIDPPYTVKGKGKRAGNRLYKHCELDHDRLFSLVSKAAGNFLMTYDNDESVRELAKKYSFDFEAIAMKGTHHAEMTELLIGRDLRWAKS
ncbi:MAG: adenine methylase [Blastocatellia bacterium]|nr:adenine methylase [Blastocatellia bacterium]